jgi:hypothetical protein
VPSAERFVRHHHRQTDHAISRAFARLRGNAAAWSAFTTLLDVARRRAPGLLLSPTAAERHPGIDTLEHLARACDRHVRRVEAWTGSDAGWQGAAAALAQHAIGVYRVPAFLASAWYTADDDAWGEAKRSWFTAHAAGRSFRSLDLPIPMSRRMEHAFLRSPAHAEIGRAMRRAELLTLGADAAFADAILATRPAQSLEHGDFWRTAWIFLIANARAIPRDQLAPIVDFLHGIRHERVSVETPSGIEDRGPQDPQFSLQGRTVRSVLRLMAEWHRALGRIPGRLEWPPSVHRPMTVELPAEDEDAPPTRWELIELTSAAMLREEGAALKHCVASYGRLCANGRSRIWSLRRRRDGPPRPVLTIEVDPSRRAIVQVRGLYNRSPMGRSWQLVQTWARREQLRLSC